MATLINQPDGLIGDFLGTIPVIEHIASQDETTTLVIHPEAEPLSRLIPAKYNIKIVTEEPEEQYFHNVYKMSSSKGFECAIRDNTYMTQAYFTSLGFPTPIIAPKADLEFETIDEIQGIDFPYFINNYYIISPFARSLPQDQKLEQKVWQEIVDSKPNTLFALIGNSKYDDKNFIVGKNIERFFDLSFDKLCNLFEYSLGLISVVTGTSHLAFHLGVKNILLNNQDFKWGTNPDAIQIRKPIPTIVAGDILKYI